MWPFAWSPDGKLLGVGWRSSARDRVMRSASRASRRVSLGGAGALGRLVAGELLVVRAADGTLVRHFPAPGDLSDWPGQKASWTADGAAVLVSVVSSIRRESHVFRCSIDTGESIDLLTVSSLWELIPSPDARTFALYDAGQHTLDLYDENGVHQRLAFHGLVSGYVWLPDGSMLLGGTEVSTLPEVKGLFHVPASAGPLTRLTSHEHIEPHQRAGFAKGTVPVLVEREMARGPWVSSLGVADLPAGQLRTAECYPAASGQAALALGGRVVLLMPYTAPPRDLWALRMRDGGWVNLTDCGDIGSYAVSPDGSKVALSRGQGNGLWILALDEKAIMAAKPASFKTIITEPLLTKVP